MEGGRVHSRGGKPEHKLGQAGEAADDDAAQPEVLVHLAAEAAVVQGDDPILVQRTLGP